MNHFNLIAVDMGCSVLRGTYNAKCNVYGAYGTYFGDAAWVLAFNGEARDDPTGGYLLGNGRRAYSPALQRFLSEDKLSPFSQGGINAYAYCLGDPVNRVDPSGALSIWGLLKRVVWIGSRIKAALSNPNQLKTLLETAKWGASIGSLMSYYEVPGGNELVTASGVVKIGAKTVNVARFGSTLIQERWVPATVLAFNDVAGAGFSPFVGPMTGDAPQSQVLTTRRGAANHLDQAGKTVSGT